MAAKKIVPFFDKIKEGDCIELLKDLPDSSIDCCITDPPYNYEFIGQKWDNNEIKRRVDRVKESKTLVKNIPYGSGLSGGVRDKKWYERNRKNTLEYMQWIETWGSEVLRVLKPGGYVFTFNSSRSIANVQVALENVGFYARDILVWRRNSGIPKGLNVSKKLEKMGDPNYIEWDGWHSCFRNEWEAISLVQKPLEKNYINTLTTHGVGLLHVKNNYGFCSNILENITRDKIDDFNEHVTVKPLELIKKLIKFAVPENSEYVVLDPFIGSGTTALAAKQLGVHYVGFEKSPDYIKIAQKRIQETMDELLEISLFG